MGKDERFSVQKFSPMWSKFTKKTSGTPMKLMKKKFG